MPKVRLSSLELERKRLRLLREEAQRKDLDKRYMKRCEFCGGRHLPLKRPLEETSVPVMNVSEQKGGGENQP